MEYHAFFKGIDEAGIDCLLTGGLALNFHGLPRMTYDADLIPEPSRENFDRTLRQMLAWGFVTKTSIDPRRLADPQERTRWSGETGEKVIRFRREGGPVTEVDIALESHASYDLLKKRAVVFHLHGIPVRVVSLEDLKDGKKARDRSVDREDLESLAILAALRDGEEEVASGPRRDQIVAFRSWPVEKRVEWLQTGALLLQERPAGDGRGQRGGGRLKRRRIPGLNHPDYS